MVFNVSLAPIRLANAAYAALARRIGAKLTLKTISLSIV
jgi:hypothetical protein